MSSIHEKLGFCNGSASPQLGASKEVRMLTTTPLKRTNKTTYVFDSTENHELGNNTLRSQTPAPGFRREERIEASRSNRIVQWYHRSQTDRIQRYSKQQ